MNHTDLVSAILTLLNGGNAWCKGANARDSSGRPCSPLSPNAVQWDFMGALIKSYEGVSDYTEYHKVLSDLTANIPLSYKNRDIESFNDDAEWGDLVSLTQFVNIKGLNAHTGETVNLSL